MVSKEFEWRPFMLESAELKLTQKVLWVFKHPGYWMTLVTRKRWTHDEQNDDFVSSYQISSGSIIFISPIQSCSVDDKSWMIVIVG